MQNIHAVRFCTKIKLKEMTENFWQDNYVLSVYKKLNKRIYAYIIHIIYVEKNPTLPYSFFNSEDKILLNFKI